VDRLRPGIAMCRDKATSPANLFEDILASRYIDSLKTNLS
jgi:hypothetical protein